MPCDSGMSYGSGYNDAAVRAELERLTRVSCDVLRVVTQAGVPLTNFSEETQKWWLAHQQVDAARIERERQASFQSQVRQAALAKLTPAERRTLGLPDA